MSAPQCPPRGDAHRSGVAPIPATHPRSAVNYRPVTNLGAGGQGSVWACRATSHRTVALKQLHPHLAADEHARAALAWEAHLLWLMRGSGAPLLVDADLRGPSPWFAMELLVGAPLSRVRKVMLGARTPPAFALELGRRAALALSRLHSLEESDGSPVRAVHCDVALDNLVLTLDGGVKLIDYGIAAREGQRAEEEAIMGKAAYIPPERLCGEAVSQRGDVYSLAVVITRLLARRDDHALPEATLERAQGLEATDRQALVRALDPLPSSRVESALELRRGLSGMHPSQFAQWVRTLWLTRAAWCGAHTKVRIDASLASPPVP